MEALDFRSAPDGEILVQIRLLGTGKQTGLPSTRDDVFQVWTVREGKAFRCRVFFDRDEALEAVGLQD